MVLSKGGLLGLFSYRCRVGRQPTCCHSSHVCREAGNPDTPQFLQKVPIHSHLLKYRGPNRTHLQAELSTVSEQLAVSPRLPFFFRLYDIFGYEQGFVKVLHRHVYHCLIAFGIWVIVRELSLDQVIEEITFSFSSEKMSFFYT